MDASSIIKEDDYTVIKQIGKGSFSNVYLCKLNDYHDPHILNDHDNDHNNDLFIIKEININELVKRYIAREKDKIKEKVRHRKVSNKQRDDAVGVSITPYQKERKHYEDALAIEREYYYKRLHELIKSEIEVLSTLNHPNIIKFYGYSKRNGIYSLRMEYCNNGDVYEYLKGKDNNSRNIFNGFSNNFLTEFIKQTVSGLKYLHDHNVIHRDIKLHNVLISADKTNVFKFKISDFGFACYDLSATDEEIDYDDVLSKKYFKLCGTPYYMAPEIVLNIDMLENITKYRKTRKNIPMFYNKKIDIWSYGICVYELLFNILPFSNIKTIQDLEKFYGSSNIQEIVDSKICSKGTLSDHMKMLLLNMLRINANERYDICKIYDFINDPNFVFNFENNDNDELQDLIECEENTYLKNEKLKEHIVRNPVQSVLSWEKINKSSSIIMKMSGVKRGFLDWLLKN